MKSNGKTVLAMQHPKDGDFNRALAIFSTFRYGFSPDERRTLQIAHESLSGHENFYRSIGINTEEYISKAKLLLISEYLKIKY